MGKWISYELQSWRKSFKRDWHLYLLLLIPLALVIIFNYAAYPGLRMVFMDYKPAKGYAGSKWVGWETFAKVFRDKDFIRALKNSIVFNLLDLAVSFPMPIILAIMLYEMNSLKLKKVYQTLMYLPHFLSWVIIGSLVSKIFGTNGPINNLITSAGGQSVNFLMDEGNWVVMYVVTGIWQSAGWGTIIYLAAISGVNTELYEAAEVDGCGRLRRIWYVTLPCIMPTIVIMLILQLGQMVGIGFERPYVMMNDMVRNSADVISTFVYNRGILNRQYPFATAVDIFGSVVNMCFVIGANLITRRLGEGGLF